MAKTKKKSPKQATKKSKKTRSSRAVAPQRTAKKSTAKAAKAKSRTAQPAKQKAKTRRAPAAKAVAKKAPRTTAKATAKKSPPAIATRRAAKTPPPRSARTSAPRRDSLGGRRPNLDRERRTVREEEEMVPSPPSSLNLDRSASAARSGGHELANRMREHTSTGPAMTGGDVDGDWEDAEAVGDEAPGGDNPTPDQDVVDEIGKALGVEYDDDEELQGGDEIVARDRKRWELDPASKDDFDEE